MASCRRSVYITESHTQTLFLIKHILELLCKNSCFKTYPWFTCAKFLCLIHCFEFKENHSTPEVLCWDRVVSHFRVGEMADRWIYHLEGHSRKHKRVHSHTCTLTGRHIQTHLHLLICYLHSLTPAHGAHTHPTTHTNIHWEGCKCSRQLNSGVSSPLCTQNSSHLHMKATVAECLMCHFERMEVDFSLLSHWSVVVCLRLVFSASKKWSFLLKKA